MADTDPEVWQPGEKHYIPRMYGDGYMCAITNVGPAIIEFEGPTGAASITRDLYARLTR